MGNRNNLYIYLYIFNILYLSKKKKKSITYYKSWILKMENSHINHMCHFLNAYNKDTSFFFIAFNIH